MVKMQHNLFIPCEKKVKKMESLNFFYSSCNTFSEYSRVVIILWISPIYLLALQI